MSVIDGSLLISLLAVLSNVYINLNGGLTGLWLAFLTIGARWLLLNIN